MVHVDYTLQDKDGFDVTANLGSGNIEPGKTVIIRNTSFMDYEDVGRVSNSTWNISYEEIPNANPRAQLDEQLKKLEEDPLALGELLDKSISAGKITEDDLRTQGNEKYLKALAEYRKHQEESLFFPINLLEIRHAEVAKQIGFQGQGADYFALTGSIYNKSKSDTATDIVIRFYYYEKEVLVDTEEKVLQTNNSPLSIGPHLAKAFDEVHLPHAGSFDEVYLSQSDIFIGKTGRLAYKIVSARRNLVQRQSSEYIQQKHQGEESQSAPVETPGEMEMPQ